MRHGVVRYVSQLVAVALLLTMAAMLPASASDIAFGSLTASCTEDGALIVWQVTTSTEAEHPSVLVEWSPAGANAWQTLGEGPLTAGGGFTFAGTGTAVVEDESVDVRATALAADAGGGDWADGRSAGQSVVATLPVIDCRPDVPELVDGTQTAGVDPAVQDLGAVTAEPTDDATTTRVVPTNTAEIAQECGSRGDIVVVRFGTDSPDAVTFEVRIDGRTVDELMLSDGTAERRYPVEAARPHEISVRADGEEVADAIMDPDCTPSWTTTARALCETGTDRNDIVVTVTTDSPTPVTIEVTIDDELRDSYPLAAGELTERYQAGGGGHHVVVEADGVVVFDTADPDTPPVDCQVPVVRPPVASVSGACGDPGLGVLTVEVESFERPAEVTVAVALAGEPVDVEPSSISLAAFDSRTETYQLPTGVYSVVVTAAGEATPLHEQDHDLTIDADGDCDISPPPAFSIAGECDATTRAYGVVGSVTPSDAGSYALTVGDETHDLGSIEADETREFDVRVPRADTYAWQLTLDGDPDPVLESVPGGLGEEAPVEVATDAACEAPAPQPPIVTASGYCLRDASGDGTPVVELELVNRGQQTLVFDVELSGPDLGGVLRTSYELVGPTTTSDVWEPDVQLVGGLPVIADLVISYDDDGVETVALEQAGLRLDLDQEGEPCQTNFAFSISGACDATSAAYEVTGTFEFPEAGDYVIELDGRTTDIGAVAAATEGEFTVRVASSGTYPYELSRDGDVVDAGEVNVAPSPACVVTGVDVHDMLPTAAALLLLGSGMVATARRRRWS